MIAETGTKRLDDTRVRLLEGLPARRSFLVDVRHLVSSHRFAHDEGLVTFDLSEKTFTVSLDALRASGPIWYEEAGVFLTLASDATTFEAYQKEVLRRGVAPKPRGPAGEARASGSIASMVVQRPEQSLSGVKQGQPERQPVAMMLGCKYNHNRYRIEVNGDITMEMGDYGGDSAHRFMFGMGRWSRVANYTDPAPVLIHHVERRDGALRVHQESFAVPLLKPVGAALEGDEPIVVPHPVQAQERRDRARRGDLAGRVFLPGQTFPDCLSGRRAERGSHGPARAAHRECLSKCRQR